MVTVPATLSIFLMLDWSDTIKLSELSTTILLRTANVDDNKVPSVTVEDPLVPANKDTVPTIFNKNMLYFLNLNFQFYLPSVIFTNLITLLEPGFSMVNILFCESRTTSLNLSNLAAVLAPFT